MNEDVCNARRICSESCVKQLVVSVMVVDAQASFEVPPQDSADPSSPFQEQDDAMGARSLP